MISQNQPPVVSRQATIKHGQYRDKIVYVPNMCDHSHILAAAMRFHGIPAQVLPMTDDESLAIGLDWCNGRECLPCFLTTGDYVRLSRQPGFDPARSVLLMASSTGACRFGQYSVLQRRILDEIGMGAMEIIVPDANNAYQGFGENPTQLRQLAWQGAVAIDSLQKLQHQYRPYEVYPGSTNSVYQTCLDHLIAAVDQGGGKHLEAVMHVIAGRFETLPIQREEPRPLIALLGEVYMRFNDYSNMNIVQRIEQAGGEVMVASMMEWFYYTNWEYARANRMVGHHLEALKTWLIDRYQFYYEAKLVAPVKHLLHHPYEVSVDRLMNHIKPYYDPSLGNETVLTLGKAVEMAHQGASGIVNVMPFSCMPGIITATIASRMRKDLDHIPWLDVMYDTQGGTNLNTRMEAFMYQAHHFMRRRTPAA
ncbi:MAG: hypothetical protein HC837_17435 [Chloroflexaceae bacterium]|nr:hypothetical protein [Chloroflexaceae bacterium]